MTRIHKITDYKGSARKFTCLACAREKREVDLGDIVKSKYFDAHQDYEIPIPGTIIITSRRHIQSVDEFTKEEQLDFIDFLCQVRSALRKILNIDVVYMYQREDTSHHYHLCILPRYDWMTEKFGRKIGSVRSIVNYARKNLKIKREIEKTENATKKLKQFFQEK